MNEHVLAVSKMEWKLHPEERGDGYGHGARRMTISAEGVNLLHFPWGYSKEIAQQIVDIQNEKVRLSQYDYGELTHSG